MKMKIYINNMACGSCRMKLQAMLKEAGFVNVSFTNDLSGFSVEGNPDVEFQEFRKLIKDKVYEVNRVEF